ncbi:MAG: hypothetical protein V4735_04200 [Pseudomonadota bacterium]
MAAIVPPVISVFDTPAQVKRLTVATDAGTNEEVDCFYYRDFMVKQVDAHEKGAAQLSFLPIRVGDRLPECQRSNLNNEQVIPATEWSGYFTGAKGSYAFFDADDGVNGSMGFAIYDAKNATKRFQDFTKGNLQSLTVSGDTLTMRYMRAYPAPCSVVTGGEACWAQIVEETKLPETATAPDCAASYTSANNYLARARCRSEKGPACYKRELAAIATQTSSDTPSMIGYPASVTLSGSRSDITPEPGKPSCWPAS